MSFRYNIDDMMEELNFRSYGKLGFVSHGFA